VAYAERRSAEDAIEVLHDSYKIRVDADQPIQVSWPKDTSMEAAWGSPSKPAGMSGSIDMAPNSTHNDEGFKLFVGGLPEDVTEEEIKVVFGTYGEVNRVHIMKPNGRSGLRGAFVFYARSESADDAIQVLDNKYKIRQDAVQPIQVRYGKEDKNRMQGTPGPGASPQDDNANKLFVGSLPIDITEDELRMVFGTYGEVTQVLVLSPKNVSGMKAAFIFYARREDGEDAISALHDVYKIREDATEPIQVKWGKPRMEGGQMGMPMGFAPQRPSGTCWGGGGGFQGNGGKGCQGFGGGWQDGKGGFQDRGKGGCFQDRSQGFGGWNGNSYGQGGGNFQGQGGFTQRMDSGKGNYGKSDFGRGDFGKGAGKSGPGEPSSKLYIANLPEDIDEQALKYVFTTYGTVESCHIMNQTVKHGAIAAFVEMRSIEEAQVAITSLNDKYEIRPGYGPIQVRYATSKPRAKPY